MLRCKRVIQFRRRFEGDRPAPVARSFTVPPDLVDQRLKLGDHGVEFCEITKECIFGTDGFADAIGADWPLVDAARNPIIVGAGLSKVRFEKC